MRVRRYHTIKAWQLSDDLAIAIYHATNGLPEGERYGLVSQMRRAYVSIAANIAEGASRSSQREYLQFLYVARGSLAELRYYLHLTKRLGYFSEDALKTQEALGDEVGRVLFGLMKSVKDAIRVKEDPALLSTAV